MLRAATVLTLCAILSLLDLGLIGARFIQVRVHHPVPAFQQSHAPGLRRPKAYTPKRATAHLARQHRKERPPTVLGRLDQAGVTRYCVATIGPLTTAEPAAGAWLCKPFLGTARPADLTAACRLVFDDTKARADRTGTDSWRCVK